MIRTFNVDEIDTWSNSSSKLSIDINTYINMKHILLGLPLLQTVRLDGDFLVKRMHTRRNP